MLFKLDIHMLITLTRETINHFFSELIQPTLFIILASMYFDVLAEHFALVVSLKYYFLVLLKRFVGVEKLEMCINRVAHICSAK